jgi:hypothetical protein
VSSSCRKDNLDTNIATALALSAMVILSILCVFTITQLLKIVIILKSIRLHQARAAGIRFFVLRLCQGSLIFIHDIQFFFCASVKETHRLQRCAKLPVFKLLLFLR